MQSNNSISSAYRPFQLGGLKLRNRFIKVATYEGMTRAGIPTDKLAEFHARIAAGNIALNTIAYGAVQENGRTHEDQLLLVPASAGALREVTNTIHSAGGKASIQLTHCGYFTRNKHIKPGRPVSPGKTFNAYGIMSGLAFSRSMSDTDLDGVRKSFGVAALLAVSAGFDAIEIHMGHGYLLSQFLTPAVNTRRDAYGGDLHNRMRFPLAVLREVRNAVGVEVPILVKLNLSDGFRGGLEIEESIQIACILSEEGADAIVLSGSYTSKTPFYLMRGDVPMKGMISVEKNILQKVAIALFGPAIMRKYDFKENYFMELAIRVRRSISAPLVYQGGVVSSVGIADILEKGFDMIGIGRALIHNPNFIQSVLEDAHHISPCNHCNQCMVEMDRGGVRCVL